MGTIKNFSNELGFSNSLNENKFNNNRPCIISKDVITFECKRSEVIIYKDHNLVVKRFKNKHFDKSQRKSSFHCWYREKECLIRLNKLKNNIHFPKLLFVDRGDLAISMSYCGEHITSEKRPELLPQIKSIADALEEANIKIISKNVARDRLLLQNGILKLIDFEDCLPDGEDINFPDKDVQDIYGKEFVTTRRENNIRSLFEKEIRRAILHAKPFRPVKKTWET